MDELFTTDLVFDATDFGSEIAYGIAALRKTWDSTPDHPLTHHATNIVVTQDADGTVRDISKGIGVGRKGRVGGVTYRDVLRKEVGGWQIAQRTATLRRS